MKKLVNTILNKVFHVIWGDTLSNKEVPQKWVLKRWIYKGDYSYGRPQPIRTLGDEETKVFIGKFCSIGFDTIVFLGGEHRPDWVSISPFQRKFKLPGALEDQQSPKGNIVIGNDVWIGAYATILSGVHVGDGAVIGAGAMVTRDVKPYAIVAGNPARLIRKRFTEEQIEALLEIKWWEWDIDRILKNVNLFSSDRIDEFIHKARSGVI